MSKAILAVLVISTMAWGKTFRIGAIYPESNPDIISSSSGIEASCITKAAVREAQKSGMKISLESLSIKSTLLAAVDTAQAAARKNFDAVVGTIISSDAIPTAQILDEAKTPFIVPTATNPRVTVGKSYVIRLTFNDIRQAGLLARLTFEDFKVKKVAVIRNASIPYSDFLGTEYAKQLRALNQSIEISDYPIIDGFSQWEDLVSKMMKDPPDLVFVPLYQTFIASIYAALDRYRRPMVLLGSDIVEKRPQFLSLFAEKPGPVRFVYPNHWDENPRRIAAERYLRLSKKYCSEHMPSMAAAYAYDAIELLLEAIRKDPQARGQKLIGVIRALNFDGVMGKIVYGEDGDPIKPVYLFELHGKKMRYWKKFE